MEVHRAGVINLLETILTESMKKLKIEIKQIDLKDRKIAVPLASRLKRMIRLDWQTDNIFAVIYHLHVHDWLVVLFFTQSNFHFNVLMIDSGTLHHIRKQVTSMWILVTVNIMSEVGRRRRRRRRKERERERERERKRERERGEGQFTSEISDQTPIVTWSRSFIVGTNEPGIHAEISEQRNRGKRKYKHIVARQKPAKLFSCKRQTYIVSLSPLFFGPLWDCSNHLLFDHLSILLIRANGEHHKWRVCQQSYRETKWKLFPHRYWFSNYFTQM